LLNDLGAKVIFATAEIWLSPLHWPVFTIYLWSQ